MNFPGNRRTAGILAAVLLVSLSAAAQGDRQDEEQTLTHQGQTALLAQHYAEAEEAYQQLSKLEPASPEVHVTLGVILFKESKFPESITELQRGLQLKPNQPRVEALLAMALSETGRYEQSLPGLERGFHQTADTELRRMCGLHLERSYSSLHQDDKAVHIAVSMEDAFPSDPEVLYSSGKILGNAAFLAAQRLFQVAPHSQWTLMAAGEAHEAQGDADAALANYEDVLKMNPGQPNVHYRMGRTLLTRAETASSQADLEKAMQEFRKELEVDPSNANAAYELGEHFRKAGQYDDAQKYFAAAIGSYPQFEEAHVGIAAVFMAQNQPKRAQTDLQEAVALNPEDPVAWYRLALADRALGDSAGQREAMAKFQKTREVPGRSVANVSTAEITPQQIENPQSR